MPHRRGKERHERSGRGFEREYRGSAGSRVEGTRYEGPTRGHGYDPARIDYDRPWATEGYEAERRYAPPGRRERGGYDDDRYGSSGPQSGTGYDPSRPDLDRPWATGGYDYARYGSIGPQESPDERRGYGPSRGGYGDFRDRDEGYSSRLPSRHHGKSPMGYTRSDERIREDVCDRLAQGYVDPSRVSVRVSDGEVTLEGSVDSRSAKHQLENLASAVSGVKDVDNRLKVRSSDAADDDDARQSGKSSSHRNQSGSTAHRS